MRRHYIIQFLRESDEALFRVLVEEYSGYCVAFQVCYEDENPLHVKWFRFINSELLASRFEESEKSEPIAYDCSYHFLEYVHIHESTGEELCSFLESFRANRKQAVTVEGRTMFDTLFLLASEAVRFAMVQRWITTNFGLLPRGLARMIKCWLKLSKCLFYLLICFLESWLAEVYGDEELAKFARESAKEAKLHWARVQLKLQDCGLDFFPTVLKIDNCSVTLADGQKLDNVNLDENKMQIICGGEQGLKLLRHDPKLVRRFLFRLNGYRGQLDKDELD